MRHTFREAWSGIRRNAAMTVAVIVTMAVSLTLFGVGLLTARQVDLIKGRWYDKIEISVFLCIGQAGGTCEKGKSTTDSQRETIKTALEANPEVERVYYESQEEAFKDFQEMFKDQPNMRGTIVESKQIPDRFHIKLKNPEQYQGVVSEARGLQGVGNVQDLHRLLDKMFFALNIMKWITIGMSAALLLAAALQIANTIRMAAFTRRRELGIMRLVGASNTYILLPFLMESLFAAAIGIIASGVLLIGGLWYFVLGGLKSSSTTIAWVDLGDVWVTIGQVAIVGVFLSIVPTLLATRKYLKV